MTNLHENEPIARLSTQSTKAYLQAVLDSVNDAVFVVNADTGTIIDVNRRCCEMYGYTYEEMLRTSIGGLSQGEAPYSQADVQAWLGKTRKEGPQVFEWRAKRKDGSLFWVEVSARFVVIGGKNRLVVVARDIEERKEADEKIRQSEETYRNLFQNALVGLYRTRISDGKILESNEQLARMFGYDNREKFIAEYETGKNYADPDAREELLRRLNRDGYVENYEACFYRKDRSIFWARYSARIYPEQGWIEGVAEDITKQKDAEEKLRRSEEKYHLLAETTPDIILLHDMDGRIEYINQAGLELSGMTEAEIINRPITAFVAYESQKTIEQQKARRAGGDSSIFFYEADFIDKEGRRHTMEVCSAPVMREKNIEQLLVVARDMTDRKRAEEALKESEERYRLLFRRSPVGVFQYDMKLRITDCNDRFVAILQSSRERLVGLDMNKLLDQSVFPALRQSVEGKEGFYEGFYRATTSSAAIWVSMRTAPLIDQHGQIKGGIGIVENITAHKRAEDNLRKERERLEHILNITGTGIDIIDGDFNLHFVDQGWQKIYGDPTGRKCYEYFKGLSEPCPVCGIPRALATKEVFVTEEVLPRENNKVVEVHTIPFQDAAGKWLVAEFNVDITKRKRAEDALRKSEEKYRLIFDNVGEAIFIAQEGMIKLANQKTESFTGFTMEELTTRPFISFIHPDDRQLVIERHLGRLRGELPEKDRYESQFQNSAA